MSILVDKEIREAISSGELVIDPFDDSLVNPASLDFRLGTKLVKTLPTASHPTKWVGGEEFYIIDPTDKSTFKDEVIDLEVLGGIYYMKPGEFLLASGGRMELNGNEVNGISAYIAGKSSLGRNAVMNSSPFAGWYDPGFRGAAILELYNASKYVIKLTPGMKVGQFVFFRHNQAEKPYGSPGVGRYQDQGDTQGSLGI